MQIRQVQLATRSVDEVAHGYRALGCPVAVDGDTAQVDVGRTRLVFRTLDGATGAHHLAFTVPTGRFPAAKEWLAGVATVIGTEDADEFEGPTGWDSRSVYFDGPDRQVLELIERRALPPGPEVPRLLAVSEVGIAVPDVGAAVAVLRRHGIEPYGNPPGDDFAAVGDVDGLLVLVTPGRPWFPTRDRVPRTAPVVVDLGLGETVALAEGVLLR
jgi:catechol-2,3-dioxygenase